MISYSRRPISMAWWCVAVAVMGAILSPVIGVLPLYFSGSANGFINFARSFEWETLCAGLLGLAGGLCVVAVTRDQIALEQQKGFFSKFESIFAAQSHFNSLLPVIENLKTDLVNLIDLDDGKFVGDSSQAREIRSNVNQLIRVQPRDAFGRWGSECWPLPKHAIISLDNVRDRLRFLTLEEMQASVMNENWRIDEFGYEIPPYIGEGHNWQEEMLVIHKNLEIISKNIFDFLESARAFLKRQSSEYGVRLIETH